MTETNTQNSPARVVAGLYRTVAGALVGRPATAENGFEIRFSDTPSAAVVSASARSEDQGKLIGAKGANFRAVQTCLRVACDRMGRELVFDQAQPTGQRGSRGVFKRLDSWRGEAQALAEEMSCAMFAYGTLVTCRDVGSVTVVQMSLHGAEQLTVGVGELRDAMRTIFVAAGKAAGREVTFDLVIA